MLTLCIFIVSGLACDAQDSIHARFDAESAGSYTPEEGILSSARKPDGT